jgi:flagellar hook protein FlgE
MAFDSLFTGISGINAYQNQIDMISNDIANVGTIGFKGQRMTFADLFYETQGFATAPTTSRGGINPQEVGVGVRVNSIDTNFSQGGLQTTGINTDMAINGDGFFVLRNADGSSGATYTRDGAFSLNANGLLYDPASGLAVQGYMANSQGQIVSNGSPGNITIPLGLQSQAVGTGFGNKVGPSGDSVFDVGLGGNLDQTQWQVEEQGLINGKGAGQGIPDTISTTIYDSLGNAHQMFIKYVPDATGATAATTASPATGANGTYSGLSVAKGAATANITVTSNGPGAGYSISDGTNTTTAAAGATVSFDNATFTLTGPEPAAATSDTISITGATTGLPASVNDSKGSAHTPATRWKTEVYFNDGTSVNGSSPTSTSPITLGYAYFDQNGQFINTSGDVNATVVHQIGQQPSLAAGDQLDVTAWGFLNGNQAVAPTGSGAPVTGPIGLDFSNSTSLASTSNNSSAGFTATANAGSGYTATVLSQNGYQAGILSNISIGQDGTIQGAFTNGQNRTLGQVALATFQNEDGLHRLGGNMFQSSADSGLAQVGNAASGRFGAIIAGSLEQSNVSLADEFTKMIVAQRAFEANTRGISTADQNLQTVINIRASEN